MNQQAKLKAPKLAKVQLQKSHIHSGVNYVENEIIEVAESIVGWFEENKIGKRYTGKDPAKNSAKAAASDDDTGEE